MVTNRPNIGYKFENGDIPSHDDFVDIFKSFVHKDEDKADFQMVEIGTDNDSYVTPALLRTGLQNIGIITGNCYMPFKEHIDNFGGTTLSLIKLPIEYSVKVFKNGQLLLEGEDYTLNYNTAVITFSLPVIDRNIEVDYWYKNLGPVPGSTAIDNVAALVVVTEAGKTGFRLATSDPLNFGNIGADAVDFSYSDTPSSTFGATGESSFAMGTDVVASGFGAIALGHNLNNSAIEGFSTGINSANAGYANSTFGTGQQVASMNTTVVGQAANIVNTQILDFNATPTKPLFVVGNGTIQNADEDYTVLTRSDAFVVRQNGSAEVPSLTTSLINADTTGKIVVTKEWVQTQTQKSYEVYTALLTQTGNNAPVATVLENTLGGTVVWTRTNTGQYLATLSGAFTLDKTVVFVTTGSKGTITANAYPSDVNNISLNTFSTSDSLYRIDDAIEKTSFEIRVYNLDGNSNTGTNITITSVSGSNLYFTLSAGYSPITFHVQTSTTSSTGPWTNNTAGVISPRSVEVPTVTTWYRIQDAITPSILSNVYQYVIAGDSTPPNAPVISSSLVNSTTRINLSWTVPFDNVGVTGYELWKDDGNGWLLLAATTGTAYADFAVDYDIMYSYKVMAKDAKSNWSAFSNTTSKTPTEPIQCFVEGTLITLPDGTQKPIETLVMDQLLLSAEIETLKDTNNVLELYKWNSNFLQENRISSPITKIEPKIAYETIIINEGLLEATPSHSQLIQRDGIWKFIPLGDVVVGDNLYGINTEIIAITSVLVSLEKRNIYPLTLSPSHTYFANGILTHNYKPIDSIDPVHPIES
jgi:hypothetical protein